MYVVYAIYSDKFDKIYIGFTSDLEQRLLSHNVLGKKGWTIKFRPWRLIHKEYFDCKQQAMIRETQLKSAKGRSFIREMI